MDRRSLRLIALSTLLVSCGGPREARGPRLIRPGAPGEPSRVLDSDQSALTPAPEATRADVTFMQGMIAHHAQALTMSRLAPDRAAAEGVRLLADRIERSQGDEIGLMERWLSARAEEVPDSDLGYGLASAGGQHTLMPGMLTPQELAELAGAVAENFDRLFLIYMIRHHEGALTMVRELFGSEGAGRETVIFEFATDVDGDQRIEIARMIRMLTEGA